MAVDMFLKIEGVDGESKDDVHTDEIDVLSWSWGMSQSGSFHTGGGGGAGKVNVQDVSVTKFVDKSTPTLMQHCANGEEFASATLVVRKAGGKAPLEYVVIEMNKVMVTSLSTGGSGGEDLITENLTLNFAEVDVKYTLQKEDGSGGPETEFGYNISANKAK